MFEAESLFEMRMFQVFKLFLIDRIISEDDSNNNNSIHFKAKKFEKFPKDRLVNILLCLIDTFNLFTSVRGYQSTSWEVKSNISKVQAL